MAEIKRDPIVVTLENGDQAIAFDDSHTIGDILRQLIKENGFDETQRVLRSLEYVRSN